jgi:iron-sulfur cluster insertion protein
MSTATETAAPPIQLTEKAAPPILLTEKAASEVKRIIQDQQQSGGVPEKIYLRMRVVGGGCSGFSHKLDLDPNVNPKLDDIFEMHGVPVAVDRRSLMYLSGTTVDFHDELNKRGFSITNPNAKGTCGCGSSFSM